MKTLIHFNNFVKEINESNGRLYKQSVLKKYKDDLIIQEYLKIAFDPYRVYGISTKKLNRQIMSASNYIPQISTVLGLFGYLELHNTGTTAEIIECQNMLNVVASWDCECAELLESLICKDLSIGCDSKTINKEIPGLIPTFNVQLANKYFDKPEYVEGKTFAITTKIDGGRIIAIKENGKVSFYTRAGQKYEGLVDLEDEMMRIMPDNICLDGEITLLVRGNLSSKDAYKETMKIVRTKDKEKHGIKMLVFDAMPVSDFKTQTSSMTYIQRRQMLDCMSAFAYDSARYFELLPILYRGKDTTKITEILEEEIAKGEEGIMINILDAEYEFKRTNNLLKVKKFNTVDLGIIGFEEGTGKYAGMLGAIICEYKSRGVNVGSGFTDEQRKEIWANQKQAKYSNALVEVSYFEETKDSLGRPSLRFPTFKDFRFDKTEADY